MPSKILRKVQLDRIKLYKENYQKHDTVHTIKESLSRFGYIKVSIVVDEKMVILAGHGTYKAMEQLGWDMVPEVKQVSGLSEAQKKAYRIADNTTTLETGIDLALLEKEIQSIGKLDCNIDMRRLGVDVVGSNILSRNWEFVFLLSDSSKYLTNQKVGENSVYWNRWKIGTRNAQIEHLKACFPVELPIKAIIDYSQPKMNVLDLFLGSGSTLIACQKTKRNFFGMELSPLYCDIIINRYLAYANGMKLTYAINLNGMKYNHDG